MHNLTMCFINSTFITFIYVFITFNLHFNTFNLCIIYAQLCFTLIYAYYVICELLIIIEITVKLCGSR